MGIPTETKLLHQDSLGDTLDAVQAALFYGENLSDETRRETSLWIADRQGLPGSYAGMFAPTGYDLAFGALTFTGEPIRSGPATGHVLSEEACRALYRLGVETEEVHFALNRARAMIFKRLADSEPQGSTAGVYCCEMCSVALWRHLAASGAPEDQQRLENGISELRRHRDGQGRWRRFPFYYTLLALTEIDLPGVRDEIQYAALVIERLLGRLNKGDSAGLSEHERRRKIILERIIEQS